MNLKTRIKNSKVLYNVYYYFASFLVNCLKLFIQPDDNLILFVSYGGRHYSDSPKVIYESMRNDKRFNNYRLVWAFIHPDEFPQVEDKIKIDTIEYFKIALKSRCWITNVMVERALRFSGKKTFYFHTTHGVLNKIGGLDAVKRGTFDTKAGYQYDVSLSQSDIDAQIQTHMYGLDIKKIYKIGFPKNDILSNFTKDFRDEVRRKLGIKEGVKAILYAPTYREHNNFEESLEIDINKWKTVLGDRFIFLYRAHPTTSTNDILDSDFIIDVSKYEIVEELMIASDVLISDYSGIIFDYSILHKPILLWAYDYDNYSKERGLYFDIRPELPNYETEDQLISALVGDDYLETIDKVVAFQKKYATFSGGATEKSIDLIYKNID